MDMARITSISSLGWAHYTLYEALPRIAARGFRRIEIASFGTYCFHFNYGSPTPSELRQMLDQHGLTPVCLNYFVDFHQAWISEEIDVFVREWTRKIEHMAEVGIPMMVMHFGVRNDRDDQEVQLANAVRAFDRVGRIAEQHGIRMVLEVPHLYSVMYRPEQVLWVFERLSSPNIGALVDCSHWGVIGYDLDAFLSALGNRLWHIHLRDSAGPDTADRKQTLEMTPGDGIVDFRKFAAALDRAGYQGDVSIEFEYRDMTLDAIETEYDRGLAYLESVGWQLPEGVKRG
jgi:sugar phosphate isomerase/epimerase